MGAIFGCRRTKIVPIAPDAPEVKNDVPVEEKLEEGVEPSRSGWGSVRTACSAWDIARSEKIIEDKSEFFDRLFEYMGVKKDFEASFEGIRGRDGDVDHILALVQQDKVSEYTQMVRDSEGPPRPCRSYPDLVAAGTARQLEFEMLVRQICSDSGMDPDERIKDCPEKAPNQHLGMKRMQMGPLKRQERSEEKVRDDYGGDFGKLFDIVRASILCNNASQIVLCVEALRRRPGCTIVRIKNRFRHPLFTGYRDMLVLLQLEGGPDGKDCPHVCELQLHLAEIAALKAQSHGLYEYFRCYFRGSTEAVDARLQNVLSLAQEGDGDMRITTRRILREGDIAELKRLENLFGDMGLWELSEIPTRRILQLREHVCGPHHLDTLITLGHLAILMTKLNNLSEAELFYRRALEGKEKMLGPNHPDTLITVGNLALLMQSQNRLDEAEAFYRRALEGKEKTLGAHHENTLNTVGNLGILMEKRNKLPEAEEYYRRALEGKEKALGLEHPNTLRTVGNLGSLMGKQGRYPEAEVYCRRAVEGKEKALGLEHPSTLTAVGNLGALLEWQDKLSESEAYCRRALKGKEKSLGPDHPSTLNAVGNLGSLMEKQDKFSDAELYYRRALEGQEKALGREHPSTLIGVGNLGTLMEKQDRLSEAEEYYRRALEGEEKVLGHDHPNTLRTMGSLGTLMEKQDRCPEAEAYYRRALEGEEKTLGQENASTLSTVGKLGDLMVKQGKSSEAQIYYRRVLQWQESNLGHDHPDTLESATTVSRLGELEGRSRTR